MRAKEVGDLILELARLHVGEDSGDASQASPIDPEDCVVYDLDRNEKKMFLQTRSSITLIALIFLVIGFTANGRPVRDGSGSSSTSRVSVEGEEGISEGLTATRRDAEVPPTRVKVDREESNEIAISESSEKEGGEEDGAEVDSVDAIITDLEEAQSFIGSLTERLRALVSEGLEDEETGKTIKNDETKATSEPEGPVIRISSRGGNEEKGEGGYERAVSSRGRRLEPADVELKSPSSRRLAVSGGAPVKGELEAEGAAGLGGVAPVTMPKSRAAGRKLKNTGFTDEASLREAQAATISRTRATGARRLQRNREFADAFAPHVGKFPAHRVGTTTSSYEGKRALGSSTQDEYGDDDPSAESRQRLEDLDSPISERRLSFASHQLPS
mmetsp:Transcript_3886/g.7437  ORF Transcript_3886/g.7437 Transcript_3886/m.7437 type:complete len:386 (-) Transcript_3886:197-1354(-)